MNIHNLKDKKIQAYVELINEAEFSDPEFKLQSEEKLRKQIFSKPHYSLDDYFAAFDEEKMVAVGHSRFDPKYFNENVRKANFWIHILPEYFDSNVAQDIFKKILENLAKHKINRIDSRSYLSNSKKVELLETLGFKRTPYQRWAMKRDPNGVKVPELPEGYIYRNPRIPEEIETIVDVANQAYATRGWKNAFNVENMSKSDYYTDTNSHPGNFVIERTADNKIVASISSHIDKNFNKLKNKKRGGTYLLIVIPEERKKGFGKALTAASTNWIAEQGMEEAFLGVNHQNPDAVKVYTDIGYERFDGIQGFEYDVVN